MASDSEIVALRAVGVSPLRLLVPVLMLAAAMTALTFYINAVALPRANQAHRELVFSLVVSKARTDVKPRTFNLDILPGQMVLYVQDIQPDTGVWKNLLIHDTRDLREPRLILARTGQLVVDRERQSVRIELGPGSQHSFFPNDPREYNRTAFASMGWDLPVDEFLPDRKKLLLSKGDREMTLARARREDQRPARARAGTQGVGPLRGGVAQEVRHPRPPASSSACSGWPSPWGARRRRARPPSPSRSRSSSSTTCSSASASRPATPG